MFKFYLYLNFKFIKVYYSILLNNLPTSKNYEVNSIISLSLLRIELLKMNTIFLIYFVRKYIKVFLNILNIFKVVLKN